MDVFAGEAEEKEQRAGHQYGGVDAEHDTDGERDGKAVQGGTAEHQHGDHHGFGGAVGDDGTAHGGGNGVVDNLRDGFAAHGGFVDIFSDTVEYHHRFVHRIAEHGQDAGQHGE